MHTVHGRTAHFQFAFMSGNCINGQLRCISNTTQRLRVTLIIAKHQWETVTLPNDSGGLQPHYGSYEGDTRTKHTGKYETQQRDLSHPLWVQEKKKENVQTHHCTCYHRLSLEEIAQIKHRQANWKHIFPLGHLKRREQNPQCVAETACLKLTCVKELLFTLSLQLPACACMVKCTAGSMSQGPEAKACMSSRASA